MSTRRKCTSLFIALFFILTITTASWAGQIIRPWRASSEIVKAGESFEVWFDADVGQSVDSVKLIGPHIDVTPGFSVETGAWVYDEWSGNQYNTKITVHVPSDAPADRYDLKLKTSQGDEISRAGVKIVKEYRDSYYVMHIADGHRWQGRYDTEGVILREIGAVIKAANIIDAVVLIHAGDFHYPHTNRPDITEQRIQEYMRGTCSIIGMNEARAAVFKTPGNHDTQEKNYNKEKEEHGDPEFLEVVADWYNQTYGLTTVNFAYGNTRFIGINNGWSPRTGGNRPDFVPNYKWQLDNTLDWLDQVGKGNLRIVFKHKPQESSRPIYKPLYDANAAPGLMLAGHIHRVNSNPLGIGGFDDDHNIVYAATTPRHGRNKAPFNIYKVNNITGTCEPVGNPSAANEAIANEMDYDSDKLTLNFSDLTGEHSMTATIKNDFNFEIEGAFARFVMPKGSDYSITSGNGYIKQQFEGRENQIVDVKMDVPAHSSRSITIGPAD